MDHVKTVVEESVEGMESEQEEEGESQDGEESPEYDEHIWTSPVNAQKIVAELCEVLAKADPINADFYRSNTDAYIKKLQKVDGEFHEVVNHAERKTIIFGNKFPLRYFAEEYGLTYSAAFNGCSTETEPSVDTIAFLIDKVKEEKVPVVYHIELNNGTVANTIAEATGTKVLLFHACHNVSKEDFDKGVTYLDLMEKNVEALKEGLGNE
jgi:zinc transport system substrate-binding protein